MTQYREQPPEHGELLDAMEEASSDEQVHQTDPKSSADDLKTLKHRLAGPSILKAGQDTVDQKKVTEIIYNVSKGSKFFNNEQVKDRQLTEKIDRILSRKKQLDKLDLSQDLRRADEYISSLELSRDLSQTIVHLDCDAFYAAVEELDRPELKLVPFAVGKGVLTTCNYEARKYGCRSGMASFVAKALCPQLITIRINFDKYNAKAAEVRKVISTYDSRFESASIDEAYLNITKYCEDNDMDPEEAVQQLRAEVHEKCKITVSAGIACNAKLAKIASNKNKPNGQFRIPADRATIMDFMRVLPVRKVNGVGRVFERELDAIGIKTCGDIYDYRAMLNRLFGEKAYEFLIQCYLGLGRTSVAPAEEYERKSVGTESTFGDLSGTFHLKEKLRTTAEELEGDLKRTQCKGRTLVLKIKLHTYEVLTRQTVTPFAVYKAEDLYRFSLPMLTKLEKDIPNMRLRLMGLRCTHLVSTAKAELNFFGVRRHSSNDSESVKKPTVDADGWEVWPEAEFEEAARQEREQELEELEKLSQEEDFHAKDAQEEPTPKEQFWDCPICGRPQPADDKSLNNHIDLCLSRQTIKDAVRDTSNLDINVTSHNEIGQTTLRPSSANGKKRGRPRQDSRPQLENSVKRRAFFS